jgi:DEAD/DEAH box helicase domain-containing protein
MFEVIFDLETKNLFRDVESSDPEKLGVSVVSVYSRTIRNGIETQGEIRSFWEKDLTEMWQIFEKAERIIGFNSLKFDIPALKPYAPAHFSKLRHFDIMDQVKNVLGFRLGLDALAKDTLGKGKTDTGINAVYYWNQGDPVSLDKLKKYCEADVVITKELYDFGFLNKYLKFTDKWNNPKIIPVDFSYPPDLIAADKQISLF